jgi:hypothetical protein
VIVRSNQACVLHGKLRDPEHSPGGSRAGLA